MRVRNVRAPILLAAIGILFACTACHSPEPGHPDRNVSVALPVADPEIERLIADLGEPVAGIHGPYCMPSPHSKADDAYDLLRQHGSVAVPQLISHLDDTNTYRRAHCAGLLGEIGDTRAIEPLCKMVTTEVDAREWVISALGKFEDQRCVNALVALLSEGSGETLSLPAIQVSTGRQAAIALAAIGRNAIPSLNAALSSPNADVRANATHALALIRK